MERYYKVEEVAELLSLHPKTIQRYIREGKLRANKIGKSWNITKYDLDIFTKQGTDKVTDSEEEKTSVSAVIDIQVDDVEDSNRIINVLNATLNCKPQEYGRTSMHTQYLEYDNQLRVTLWGNIYFMKNIFEILSNITHIEGNKGV